MANNSVVVRNAQDLERKYNLGSLGTVKRNIEITAQGLQEIQNELSNTLNALVINLKDVLDSQSEISLWFYSGIPTISNVPYTSWTNTSDHIGDLYYDQNTGYVYQYKEADSTKLWEINTSPDLVEAMAITNSETDTSTDHERKVFFDTPTIPYSNGDWWVKEDGSLFICQISKTSGTFEEADFIDSSKYTESIAKKIGEEISVLKGTVTMISENYAKFTDLATGGSTTISGDNITTGSIQSNNYIKNVSGTKIALEDGTIDAKNFKVDAEGNMTCNDANISGTITGSTIKGNTITGGTISGSTITGNTISGGTIKGATIDGNTVSGGTITGSIINGGTVNGTTINSTNGEIGGWTINENGLTNGTVFINKDGSSTTYTVADLIVIRGYIMGYTGYDLPAAMIAHYDFDGDGKVTSSDYVTLQNLIGISMD